MIESFQRNVNYWVIVPAAGVGLRMGSVIPKQYMPLAKKTVLEHTINKMTHCPMINKVVVVLNRDDLYWKDLSLSNPDQIMTTTGGDTRAVSVLQGLHALKDMSAPNDWVLVHDAARPCVRSQEIGHLIQQVGDHPVGGILGVPVSDTLKHVDDDRRIVKTLSREQTWRAQTPQMFRYELLLSALTKMINEDVAITDESSAIELLGKTPKMVYGDMRNIKITVASDLVLAEKILEEELSQ